ncbi:MAG: alpha/beta hydrolase [Marinagarivorans sp.]
MTAFVFVPGYGNSLGGHWQELWYAQLAGSHWAELGASSDGAELGSWDRPDCALWVARLQACISAIAEPVVLISHSLGGLTIAHWAAQHPAACRQILGAFMVAVPDPTRPDFPSAISGYGATPLTALPFASLMVTSRDDPYAAPEQSAAFASAWGAGTWDIGEAGHINVARGFGAWPEGRIALERWQAGLA